MARTHEIVTRIQGHLKTLAEKHPGIWREVDRARAQLKKRFSWPDWCFMPMAGYFAVLTKPLPSLDKLPANVRIMVTRAVQFAAALVPWRITQGIYQFHPTVEEEVISTPLTGDLPTALFYHLPEWCVYIRYERKVIEDRCYGYFAHLEWDANRKRPELRLLIDTERNLLPLVLHLKSGSIYAALKDAINEGVGNAASMGLDLDEFTYEPETLSFLADNISGMVSLVLYLCTVNAQIQCREDLTRKPGMPKSKIVRRGETRFFPAKKPTMWEVGYRIGEALEAYRSSERGTPGKPHTTVPDGQAGSHASPRPHIRRAHWHSFWTGPRKDPDKRKLVLKWLSPILVGENRR